MNQEGTRILAAADLQTPLLRTLRRGEFEIRELLLLVHNRGDGSISFITSYPAPALTAL